MASQSDGLICRWQVWPFSSQRAGKTPIGEFLLCFRALTRPVSVSPRGVGLSMCICLDMILDLGYAAPLASCWA
jgi:hypothetical protein